MNMKSLRIVAALALTLAACGSSIPITIESARFDPTLNVNLAASTKTADGMYYRDLTVGTGATVAVGQVLGVRYLGSLIDATTFDSTAFGTPDFNFILGDPNIIPGFSEGLVGAKVGSTRQLVIPPALGYGASGLQLVPPNAILVYSVTINSVVTIENTAYNPSLNVNLAAFTKTADGLYYRDAVAGTGATVATGQTLGVRYVGSLTDGTTFDATAAGAADFSFVLGSSAIIKGFNEGLAGAQIGSTRQIIIPPLLGYGGNSTATIPANAILVFSITIDSAK